MRFRREEITVLGDYTSDENDTAEETLNCAWCLKERGEKPQPGQSHGICKTHADGIRQEQQVRRGRR